jgi:phage FluMu protein Com
MIRFACPSCSAVLNAPDGSSGTKTPCPKCKQRVQIPPTSNHTLMGKLLPEGWTGLSAAEPVPVLATNVPAADSTWYYAKNEERFGPFSFCQLQQLVNANLLQPADFVLRDPEITTAHPTFSLSIMIDMVHSTAQCTLRRNDKLTGAEGPLQEVSQLLSG